MHLPLTWINILTKNSIIYIVWNICDLSRAHWLHVKSEINGVRGVLKEAENEFWGYTSNEGAFEHPEEDFRKWVDYINTNRAITMKKISDMQSRLLEVQEKMDSLYEDNNRKEPGIDASQTKGTTLGSVSTRTDILHTLKQYLTVLRNWEAYLEDAQTRRGSVEEIQRMMNEFENQRETVDQAEILRISLILKNLRQNAEAKKENSILTCNETDSKIGKVLRQVQKNLSETFLYKNITLTEINQMSRIVDFVERYRGRVEKMLEHERREDVATSEIPTAKNVKIAEVHEN